MSKLAKLWLHDSAITGAAVPHLKRLTGLRELDLQPTKLTPAGIEGLRAALPKCEITTGREV